MKHMFFFVVLLVFIGFVLGLGFNFLFSTFQLLGFLLVSVLEIKGTSWFCSGYWKPGFVCSLKIIPLTLF